MLSRIEQAEKLRATYPTYVPIFVERYKHSTLPPGKFKMMLPQNRTIQDILQSLMSALKKNGVNMQSKGFFLFTSVDHNIVLNAGDTIESIISAKPQTLKEGWLDLIYHDHDSF